MDYVVIELSIDCRVKSRSRKINKEVVIIIQVSDDGDLDQNGSNGRDRTQWILGIFRFLLQNDLFCSVEDKILYGVNIY